MGSCSEIVRLIQSWHAARHVWLAFISLIYHQYGGRYRTIITQLGHGIKAKTHGLGFLLKAFTFRAWLNGCTDDLKQVQSPLSQFTRSTLTELDRNLVAGLDPHGICADSALLYSHSTWSTFNKATHFVWSTSFLVFWLHPLAASL